MTDPIPEELQQAIANGTCVPFVGAGMSLSVKRKDNNHQSLFCSWKGLLLIAAKQLTEIDPAAAKMIEACLEYNDKDSYYHAAQVAIDKLGSQAFNQLLQTQFKFNPDDADPASLTANQTLWRLNSSLMITTNYDNVLTYCNPNGHKGMVSRITAGSAFELQQLIQNPQKSDTVLHLHGHIDQVESLVLTSASYQQLYAGGNGDNNKEQSMLFTLQQLITRYRLLFVGFSFADHYFSQQLEYIKRIFNGNSNQHYVLCRESQRGEIESLNLPLRMISYQEHDELPELLNKLSGFATSKPAHSAATSAVTAPKTITAKQGSISYDLNNFVFFMPFRAKAQGMVGQQQPLQQLRQQLQHGHKTSIGHASGFKGLGGVGKTQLAIEYAHKYQQDYPQGVIWLTADQDLVPQLLRCAAQAQWCNPNIDDKDKLQLAIQRIRTYSQCLIIFDNVERLADIQDYLPEPSATPHLLLTSRERIKGFESINIDTLSEQDSLALLCQGSGKPLADLSPAELEAARQLIQRLEHLPLALEIAAAHIKHQERYNFSRYLELYDRNFKLATTNIEIDSFTRHDQCLLSTLQLSQDITQRYQLLPKLIMILAHSADGDMGKSLLYYLYYGEKLPTDPASSPLTSFEQALNKGIELKLIKFSGSGDQERFSLHRLVRRVQLELTPLNMLNLFTNNQQQNSALLLVDLLVDRLISWFTAIKDDFLNLSRFQQEQQHLKFWANTAKQQQWSQYSALVWLQAYPLWHLGDYKAAQELLQQAVDSHHSSQDQLAAKCRDDLSRVMAHLGHYKRAMELGKQALQIRKRLFPQDHPDVATSYANIAGFYSNLGEYQRALKTGQQALDMLLRIFQQEHLDVATSYGNIANYYSYLGEHQLALKTGQQALDMRLRLFQQDHPDVANSYSNIAKYYIDLGEYQRALKIGQQALDMRLRLFQQDHPDVAINYSNIAGCYSNLGEYQRALKTDQQALDMRLRLFQQDHPDVANSYHNLGVCYYNLQQFSQARDHIEQAYQLRTKLLGFQHAETLNTVRNLTQTLMVLKKFQLAAKYLKEYSNQLPNNHDFQVSLKQWTTAL